MAYIKEKRKVPSIFSIKLEYGLVLDTSQTAMKDWRRSIASYAAKINQSELVCRNISCCNQL